MSEKKAYDFKVLLEMLKGEGVELAEESAKIVVKQLFSWLEESATLSATPYDDLLKVVYPQVKALAMEAADNINPKDNE